MNWQGICASSRVRTRVRGCRVRRQTLGVVVHYRALPRHGIPDRDGRYLQRNARVALANVTRDET